MSLRLLIAPVILASAISCARVPTEVVVQVNADPLTLARTARVHIRVWNEQDELRLDRVVRVMGSDSETMFPLSIPLIPRNNDASRSWRAHVEALDADNRKFNEVRALSTYVADQLFEVRLRLEDTCIDQLTCAEDQTCRRGECTDAHVTPTPSGVPAGRGWHELPDTRIQSVCDASFGECTAISAAWSGGAADTAGERMLVWGGGGEYRGNQVFEFDLPTRTMRALDTATPTALTCDPSAYLTRPAPRSTYDGLVYLPDQQRMLAVGGASWCGPLDTWMYDPETTAWERVSTRSLGMYPHVATAYDRDRGVLIVSPGQLRFFDPVALAFTDLPGPDEAFSVSATLDTNRRILGIFGSNHYWEFDVARSVFTTPSLTGCEAALAAPAPGMAFDSVLQQFVIWSGGDNVTLLDIETHRCTVLTFPNGPGAQVTTGTYGRFDYFPSQDLFVLVNRVEQNVFALRLR